MNSAPPHADGRQYQDDDAERVCSQLSKRRKPFRGATRKKTTTRRHNIHVGSHGRGDHRNSTGHALDQLVGTYHEPKKNLVGHNTHIELKNQRDFFFQTPGFLNHLDARNFRAVHQLQAGVRDARGLTLAKARQEVGETER